jgi:hypothetical protein
VIPRGEQDTHGVGDDLEATLYEIDNFCGDVVAEPGVGHDEEIERHLAAQIADLQHQELHVEDGVHGFDLSPAKTLPECFWTKRSNSPSEFCDFLVEELFPSVRFDDLHRRKSLLSELQSVV